MASDGMGALNWDIESSPNCTNGNDQPIGYDVRGVITLDECVDMLERFGLMPDDQGQKQGLLSKLSDLSSEYKSRRDNDEMKGPHSIPSNLHHSPTLEYEAVLRFLNIWDGSSTSTARPRRSPQPHRSPSPSFWSSLPSVTRSPTQSPTSMLSKKRDKSSDGWFW